MSSIPAPARRISDGAEIEVTLAEETALAVTYDGSTQAVLMGTPADLEDFAYGFSLTEGIARPRRLMPSRPSGSRRASIFASG